jgi:glutathione S-transferase
MDMQLIGYLESPFVRRVAISARFLGVPFDHRELSIFNDYDEFRAINPMVKVPTLLLDDGQILVDSTLIIGHLEALSSNGFSLMPDGARDRVAALRHIGQALVVMEKGASLAVERRRPEAHQSADWLQRVAEQLSGALELIEATVTGTEGWIFGERISHADIAIAVAWYYIALRQFEAIDYSAYPAIARLSDRTEVLPEFRGCPVVT